MLTFREGLQICSKLLSYYTVEQKKPGEAHTKHFLSLQTLNPRGA